MPLPLPKILTAERTRNLFSYVVWIVALAVSLLFINLLVTAFISREKEIYSFDSVGFWDLYIKWGQMLMNGKVFPILREVWNSMKMEKESYNWLIVLPLVPWYPLFGTSRVGYISAIANAAAFPAALSFGILMYAIGSRTTFLHQQDQGSIVVNVQIRAQYFFAVALITILTNQLFWTGILRDGLIDVFGLIIVHSLVLLWYFTSPRNLSITRTTLFSALLGALIILRRWFTIWVVAFILAGMFSLLVDIFTTISLSNKSFLKAAVNVLFKVILMISLIGLLLFCISRPFLVRIITENYSNNFSVFQIPNTNWLNTFKTFSQHLGWLQIQLALLGFSFAVSSRSARQFAIFLLLQGILSYVLFTRIQFFSLHHFYIVLSPILFFISYFIAEVTLYIKRTIYRLIFLGAYSCISIAILVMVFFPEASSYRSHLLPIIPQVTFYPLTATDIQERVLLLNELRNLLQEPSDRAYILSSSSVLNFLQLKFMYLSLNTQKLGNEDKIMGTASVDEIDGFPSSIFNSSYIVLPVPIQGSGAGRMVVEIPAKQLLEKKGMGTAFIQLPQTFLLRSNTTVRIYKRIRPFTKLDIQSLSDELKQYYPDKPRIYQPDYSQIRQPILW